MKQVIAGQGNYMITLYNFSIYDSPIWVLNTGSSFNICNSLQGLRLVGDLRKMKDSLMLEMEDQF